MNSDIKNDKKEANDSSDEELGESKPSYTYWKRESDNPFSNDFKPQKSDTNLDNQNDNTSNYGSAWNKAGTWEEKHLTKKQMEEFFNDLVDKKNCLFSNSFRIKKVSNYSGDVRFRINFNYSVIMYMSGEKSSLSMIAK